tara:strand:+ start:123 stop:569 length:447 start_codon:yes stop_codon:yes gene_type:complete
VKRVLTILITTLLWCNIGYSNEIVNLVCLFEKTVEDIPLATSGSGEIVKNKDDYSPSVTQDKYIEYEVVSKDEGKILNTDFYHGDIKKLSNNLVLNIDDKEMAFVVRYHEEWVDVFILNRYTGSLQQVVKRFEENIIYYYSCSKKSKI